MRVRAPYGEEVSHADLALAAVAALGSAAAFGAASAVQHEQAGVVERREALDPRLIASLARRPIWLLGIVGDILGVGLQLVALRFGPVPLVQPLIVAALPVAVVVSAVMRRVRVSGREAIGLLLCSLGLVLLTPASATEDLGHAAGAATWSAAAMVLVVTVGASLLLARLRPTAAPVGVGLAAGITAGASAVLLAVCAARIGDPIALLTSPAPYAVVVVGVVALLLTQAAFQTGALAVPLATLTVTEPIVAVVLAAAVMHQTVATNALLRVAAGAGAAAAVLGVILLARERARD
jgi:drug/metabolite transporter (DMT)-like permease